MQQKKMNERWLEDDFGNTIFRLKSVKGDIEIMFLDGNGVPRVSLWSKEGFNEVLDVINDFVDAEDD